MTHTPGPWTFGHWGKDFWIGTDSLGENKLAKVFWDFGTLEQGRKNACLIAAAPELLEALKAVMDEWRDGYGLNCVEQVRAAISKAEGRT